MFLYEKNGKLNFQFGSGQLPTPTPTLELDKKELRIGSTIIPESDHKVAADKADFSIASSTMIPVKDNILKKVPNALTIV